MLTPPSGRYLLINLIAGADTTAFTMSAVFYLLLKHPSTLAHLTTEILAADFPTDRPVPYRDAFKLPYLHAVIREAMRIYPAVGMPLERYVPASGLRLPDDTVVPSGTAVGMNPYIVNRTTPFGHNDTEEFRPERWQRGKDETEAAFLDRLAAMNAADLTFGAGSRMCGGRHIAQLEVYKLVATLLLRFNFELVDNAKQWTIKNGWFFRVRELDVRISRR